jgi:dienelactone hydrolase
MKVTAFACALLVLAIVTARAEVKTETVEYKDGDATLKGFLAYDTAAVQGKRPGVLVVPEWWGVNDYAKSRAEQLAKLGYVAFVADIYGDGFITTDVKVAGERAGQAKEKGWLRSRGKLALEQLRKQPLVDSEKIAAIGYCFGGTTVLELARAGEDLKGVVSFHGALDTKQPAKAGDVKPKILVLHGAADPLVPPDQVKAFEQEMNQARADYEIIPFEGAKHSFTNPDADKVGMPAVAYNKAADEKSWRDMQAFIHEVFGTAAPKPAE